MRVNSDIQEHIAQCVHACELELYGTEYVPGSKQHTIRIYIDSKTSGVGADDCQKVGQYLRDYASVHCPFLLQSHIEVSSPGLDRVLFTLEHCQANIGKKIRCKTKTAIENRKNFTGKLLSVENETLQIEVDQAPIDITWSNVEKTRLIYDPENTI